MIVEEIEFNGHPEVRGEHKTTMEITMDKHLTEKGDCIIGVNARTSCNTLNNRIKEEIQKDNNEITIELIVEDPARSILSPAHALPPVTVIPLSKLSLS